MRPPRRGHSSTSTANTLRSSAAQAFCPTPRAYRVFERDGYRCAVPGCTAQRNLHAHHVLFRSRGGSDDLANLVTLCAAHHQRGVHRGVIRISGSAPEALVFELPLCVYRSGDRAVK